MQKPVIACVTQLPDICCLAVKNHGIDKKLIVATFEENKKFFALPLAEKTKIAAGNVKQYR